MMRPPAIRNRLKNIPAWYAFIVASEDQEPDATIEMHLGAGNVPAFRGYVLSGVYDLQLKDFANRIPNISAEVVAQGAMQSDIFDFPPATTMTKEGGILDQSRGTMIGTGCRPCLWKYDCGESALCWNACLADPNWSAYLSRLGRCLRRCLRDR
jgi:hypothetical protein